MAIHPNPSFLEAIKVFGSQAAMARAIKKPVQLINQIKLGTRRMPDAWAPLIEEGTATLGRPVLCENLAPLVNWTYLRRNPQARNLGTATEPVRAEDISGAEGEVHV